MKFEVERFGVSGSDRLEVAGRWFGVRGRRFLRPTLEFEANGERQRALAVMDHKPWTAEDGEEWVAAFHWDGDPEGPAAAELAVGTDLTVKLRDEEAEILVDREAEQRAAEQRAAERAALHRAHSDLDATRRELEAARSLAAERDVQIVRLGEELSGIRRDCEELRTELDSATARGKGAASATERARVQRDEAQSRVEAITAERDQLVAELDRVKQRRQEVEAELESARAERDAARAIRLAPRTPADPQPVSAEPAEWRVRAAAAAAIAVPLLILAVLTAFDI